MFKNYIFDPPPQYAFIWGCGISDLPPLSGGRWIGDLRGVGGEIYEYLDESRGDGEYFHGEGLWG